VGEEEGKCRDKVVPRQLANSMMQLKYAGGSGSWSRVCSSVDKECVSWKLEIVHGRRVHEPDSAAATQGPRWGHLEPLPVKSLTSRCRRAVDRYCGSRERRVREEHEISFNGPHHHDQLRPGSSFGSRTTRP